LSDANTSTSVAAAFEMAMNRGLKNVRYYVDSNGNGQRDGRQHLNRQKMVLVFNWHPEATSSGERIARQINPVTGLS
jgi:hypothetical protein